MLPFLCKRWPGPISIAILEEDREVRMSEHRMFGREGGKGGYIHTQKHKSQATAVAGSGGARKSRTALLFKKTMLKRAWSKMAR